MDNKDYKINECAVLIYLMEASMKATLPLYNGKIYHMYVIEKKKTGVFFLVGGLFISVKRGEITVNVYSKSGPEMRVALH